MNKLISSLLFTAVSASACAQMSSALISDRAAVSKLPKQPANATECDTNSQTCLVLAGTVGESIKNQRRN